MPNQICANITPPHLLEKKDPCYMDPVVLQETKNTDFDPQLAISELLPSCEFSQRDFCCFACSCWALSA